MKFKTGSALAGMALVGSLVVTMLPSVSSAATKTVNDRTFNARFTTMKYLRDIVTKGHGSIAVILPDTVSSARWADFDAPAFKSAFNAAGLKPSQYIVQNALGSDLTQYSDAQADIAKGAKVLILTSLDSSTSAVVEAYAVARGVKVIDYDRLTLGGARSYYVSFKNVAVGRLIGKGLLACITKWHVSAPDVLVMKGAPSDNNATLFAEGYDAVLNGAGFKTKSGSSNTVLERVGTWTPDVALTDFEREYAAHPKINAVLTPSDENAAPIIQHLQGAGLKPRTIPFTGQGTTLVGIQNVISGYQCGTVYKPSWLEAQVTTALAIYLRAHVKPPSGLVNSSTTDSGATNASYKHVPSVLLSPKWVTASKVESTVVKDKVLKASVICTSAAPTVAGDSSIPTYSADCTTYGIK
jgi:D-xylose transport system substrate-binding protein